MLVNLALYQVHGTVEYHTHKQSKINVPADDFTNAHKKIPLCNFFIKS